VIANYPAQIDVPAGQSAVVRLRRPAQRVAIADPEVADVVLVSPTEILVNGRGRRYNLPSGEPVVQEAQTSLIVWDKDGQADVRALYVNRSRMEQVELHVTVAELNRSAIEAQGFDFQVLAGSVTLTGTPAKVAQLTALANGLLVSPDRVTFAVQDAANFQAFIELMEREALAKVLARPTLMARSGEEAHFRSGGEIPIALVTSNTTAVQFKEFGVIVTFTPTFTADGLIDLRVVAELSTPDRTRGIVVSGSPVPEFISRQASTRVRLRDQQSLMIAGLLRDDETEDERKVPYLGDLPYLGALFRTTSFEHTKSELMILVQPEVSKMGRDDGQMALPTARGPLTRAEVRTGPSPNVVSRPRVFGCARRPCAGGESPVTEAH
jgi:pilus assembly protein CpaC